MGILAFGLAHLERTQGFFGDFSLNTVVGFRILPKMLLVKKNITIIRSNIIVTLMILTLNIKKKRLQERRTELGNE